MEKLAAIITVVAALKIEVTMITSLTGFDLTPRVINRMAREFYSIEHSSDEYDGLSEMDRQLYCEYVKDILEAGIDERRDELNEYNAKQRARVA